MSSHEISATAGLDPAMVLHSTDWAALAHAYGPAATTADDLRGLLEEDPEVQAAALDRLEMSVLHQGSLYSATAPAALFIAGVLPHPGTPAVHESFFPWDDRRRPLRAALLEWLGQFAESAAWDVEGLADPQNAAESDAFWQLWDYNACCRTCTGSPSTTPRTATSGVATRGRRRRSVTMGRSRPPILRLLPPSPRTPACGSSRSANLRSRLASCTSVWNRRSREMASRDSSRPS